MRLETVADFDEIVEELRTTSPERTGSVWQFQPPSIAVPSGPVERW
jgi:hypothetical protein